MIIEEINHLMDSTFSPSRPLHAATVLAKKTTVEYMLNKVPTLIDILS